MGATAQRLSENKRFSPGGKKGPLQILGSVGVFFDGEEINKRKDKEKLKALMAAGAFVKTIARRSIKSGGKKGKASKPGEPPRRHRASEALGIHTIFFVHEKKTDSVVVGPVKFNTGGPKILQTLERGGSIKAIRRNPKTKKKQSRVVKIAPRPFMEPAKDKALPQLIDKNPYFKKLIGGSDVRLP